MQTGKITALYARFSYDDGIDAESGSIEHQKELLKSYAESNGFTNIRYYADDGYTGTNFNRPDFQRMMSDIKNGIVGIVIVKDMSRLGRNYLMVGQFTEIDFPKYKVRFIAISDNVDSDKGMNELLPINNLMNEWYSRDISKKIRAMIRQKGNSGQHIASKLPYGYMNAPDDKQTWLIDEDASVVVRKIFDLYLNHSYSMQEIASTLETEHIPKPDYHRKIKKGIDVHSDDLYSWCKSTVRSILLRQEYCGDTVNFRTEIMSYKNKKVIHNGSDKIRIFPDTHPAIISREIFQQVQDKYNKSFRHPSKSHRYFFGDYLYCMDCHARLHGKHHRTSKGEHFYGYECSAYRKNKGCYFHSVPEEYLKKEVLKEIQKIVAYAKENSDLFYRNVQKVLDEQSDGSKAVMTAELEKTQSRITEIDRYMQGLFESKVRGEIDGSLFASLKKTYDDEKRGLNLLVADLLQKLDSKNEADDKVEILFTAIRKYDAINELTPEVLADFIEHIEVGRFKSTDKKIPFAERNNEISVFFWGAGIIKFIKGQVP